MKKTKLDKLQEYRTANSIRKIVICNRKDKTQKDYKKYIEHICK